MQSEEDPGEQVAQYTVWHVRVPTFQPEANTWPDGYDLVAKVCASSLEEAYRLTQHEDNPWVMNIEVQWHRSFRERSTSVGDVMVVNGVTFLVDYAGFIQLT